MCSRLYLSLKFLTIWRISWENKLSKIPSVALTMMSPSCNSNEYSSASSALSWHIILSLLLRIYLSFLSSSILPFYLSISSSVAPGNIEIWYGMLNECYCSLDLAAVYASLFLNLIRTNPLSPKLAILISFWFLIATIAVELPTAVTLLKPLPRM